MTESQNENAPEPEILIHVFFFHTFCVFARGIADILQNLSAAIIREGNKKLCHKVMEVSFWAGLKYF
jgi:hypothetical protein